MSDYLIRLLVMLPLVAGLIVGGLWLAKRVMAMQAGGLGARPKGAARVSETLFLTPGNRLAVVDFAGKRLLISVTKTGVSLLSEAEGFALPQEAGDAR